MAQEHPATRREAPHVLTSDCQPRGQLEPDPGTGGCLLAIEFWKIGDSRRTAPHDPLTNPNSTDQAAAASVGHRLGYQRGPILSRRLISSITSSVRTFSRRFSRSLSRRGLMSRIQREPIGKSCCEEECPRKSAGRALSKADYWRSHGRELGLPPPTPRC